MNKQLFFVKFPIIFPLIYFSVLSIFPQYETQLILITLLLLAETHFGATWPFFLVKSSIDYIRNDKIKLIIFPTAIVLFSLLGFIYVKTFFLMIFFLANVYHVTRQSYGVCKLYCKDNFENKFQEIFIYLINSLFFLIGFFRFYIPIIDNENLFLLNIIVLSLLLLILIVYKIKFGFSDNYLTFITGLIIFYPVCFVSNPVHAIIMGVTMHYSQYLYLTHYVVKERAKDQNLKKNIFSSFLFVIFVYSIAMTSLSLFGKNDSSFLNNLIIIPIIGQMLHFYLDSQLWKFSLEHNRENVLKYLKILIS